LAHWVWTAFCPPGRHEHQQGTNTNIVKCTILIKHISKWHFPEINRYHVLSKI